MRKIASLSLLLGIIASPFASSLFAHGNEGGGGVPEYIYVEMEPPADLAEEEGNSPGSGYIWVKGHWVWHNRWKWERGTWVLKPHETASWNSGHWKAKHHHWVWVPGYWS